MELIILLIIIFFVWRHFKKKKANKAERQAEYQTRMQAENDPTLGPVVPPKKSYLRGKSVTENNFPKKMKDVYTGADNFGRIKTEDTEDPDMAFACTKRAFESVSKDVANLITELGEDSRCCRCLRWGVQLAGFYRDGYGCEPNAQAAIDILLKIDPLWVRILAYIEQMLKAHRLSEEQLKYANQIISLKVDAWRSLADCYVIIGQGPVADEFYRRTYNQANAYGNPDYVREEIIRHAMGDYGDYSAAYPHPMRYAVATELALSMAGQNKPMGGHFLMALVGLRKLDVEALGHSWETDFRIYSNAEDSYSLYRTGLALLYGLGTEQNVKAGLTRLTQAYEQGSVMAAHLLYKYYDGVLYSAQLDKNQKKLANSLCTDWSWKYERMKKDSGALEKIMSTGTIDEAASEYGAKYTQSKLDRADTAAFASEDTQAGAASTAGTGEFNLSSIPVIVYDDSNRQWKRRGIYGDHAVYYNVDGGEVTIYSAQVSGSSANTSAGTLHWY